MRKPTRGEKRRAFLRERDGDRCYYCARTMKFKPTYVKTGKVRFRVYRPYEATIEHLIDRQHGGSSELQNLALACRSCNSGRNYMGVAEKLLSRSPEAIKASDKATETELRITRLKAQTHTLADDMATYFEGLTR